MATFDFLYRENKFEQIYTWMYVFFSNPSKCVDIVGNFISERTQIDFNEKTELT